MDPFLGEIRLFAGNYAPRGWALCNGQILPISSNTALYALLGTTYGGNGTSTFALPDYRGRVPVGQGQGPGLSPYSRGQTGGEVSHTLSQNEMAAHSHTLNADNSLANLTDPTNHQFGAGQLRTGYLYADGTNVAPFAPGSVGQAGNGQSHENRQAFLTLNFIIALQGVYPSRP